jgi:hypothetical protein
MHKLNITNFKEMASLFRASKWYDNYRQYVLIFDEPSLFNIGWTVAFGQKVTRIDVYINKEFDEEGNINVVEKLYSDKLSLIYECDKSIVPKDFKEQFSTYIYYKIKENA